MEYQVHCRADAIATVVGQYNMDSMVMFVCAFCLGGFSCLLFLVYFYIFLFFEREMKLDR